MLNVVEKCVTMLESISEYSGRWVSWLTLGAVLTLFVVVVLRYAFQTGSIALQESVTYMHGLIFLIGAAYTLKHDEHVRVDIFYTRFSARGKAIIDLIGTLVLLLPFSLTIAYLSWDYVEASWRIKESSSEAGGLPGLYLLKSTLLLMAALLINQGLATLGRSILTISQGAK
jgi:TRAP-type mannitol/chloroaromatic compound transport system permease small subunit|tara:strand:- start:3182 stop:3697 length:516 start_codon:yes stop_codon:yes gene_type:complete